MQGPTVWYVGTTLTKIALPRVALPKQCFLLAMRPRSAYQDQISIFDFNMRPGPSTFARPDCTNQDASQCPKGTNPGRTHRMELVLSNLKLMHRAKWYFAMFFFGFFFLTCFHSELICTNWTYYNESRIRVDWPTLQDLSLLYRQGGDSFWLWPFLHYLSLLTGHGSKVFVAGTSWRSPNLGSLSTIGTASINDEQEQLERAGTVCR